MKLKYLYRFYDKFIQDNKCQILPLVSTFCTKIAYYKNNFGVFLCVIVYRHFVLNNLMVYSAKHREYQLVAKSTVPCFLTRVIFTMSIFCHCGMPPLCPRNWAAQRKFWQHAKKNISGAKRRNLCPNFKTVSAPMRVIIAAP